MKQFFLLKLFTIRNRESITFRKRNQKNTKANRDVKVTWFSRHDCDAWKLTRGVFNFLETTTLSY